MPVQQTPLSILAIIRMVGPLAVVLLVTACSDGGVSHVWGNSDVPEAVLQQPRLVASPPQAETEIQTWLRLGDVPSKPTDFSSTADIMKKKQDMLDLRTEGQAIRAAHPELYDESEISAQSSREGHP